MDKENAVGKNIRMYRESQGLFQEELASKIGVTPKAVSAWETGKAEPRMGAILAMCNLFNCKVSDLTEKHDWTGTLVTIKPKIEIKSETEELSPDEIILLETYRKMDTKMKAHLLSYALSLGKE